MSNENKSIKVNDTPSMATSDEPYDVFDMVNTYGTFNVQQTANTDDVYPAISQGLPKDHKNIPQPQVSKFK